MKRLLGLIFAIATMLAAPAYASTPAPSNATCRLLSAAASVNATSCTAQTTYVGTIVGFNASASGRWLKIYDKASAPASTDTPRESYYLPAGAGFAFDVNNYFALGVGFRLTTGSADNDTGALTSGDVLGLNIDLR